MRFVALALAAGGLVALGVWGWHWHASGVVERVAVTGTAVVPPDTVRARARVALGTPMDTLNLARLSGRVTAHPWVQHATARTHLTTGTLALSVTEQVPVGLVVGRNNGLAYYLSSEGGVLPLPSDTAYNVPLVHGLPLSGRSAGAPDGRPAPASLYGALRAIANTPASQDLISDVLVYADSTIEARTRPLEASGSIRVSLGRDRFPQKLRRLHAFLEAMRTSATIPPVRSLDVRFDGQIIARHREDPDSES